MQNREFEKQVQQKMEELQLPPADVLWDKVEAQLPEKKPRRRIFFILLFVALLFCSGILIFTNKNATENKNTLAAASTPEFKNNSNSVSTEKINTDSPATNTAGKNVVSDKEVTATETSVSNIIDGNASSKTNIKYKQPQAITQQSGADELFATDNDVKSTAGKFSTKISSPAATEDVVISDVTAQEDRLLDTYFNERLAGISLTKTDKQQNVLTVSSVNIKLDILNSKQQNKKIAAKQTWHVGLLVAGGSSGIITQSTSLNYANNNPIFAGSGGTSISAGSVLNNNKPQTKMAWQIGFYAEKKLHERWRLYTALHYTKQATSIKIGQKVDTSFTVNYDANKSFEAENYYRPGTNASYKNNFHLLEMPISLQYRLSKNIPLYVDAGVAPGVLLSTNALVYSNAVQSYVTSPALYNKINLSVTAGAAIDVNENKKFPFSVGYSFRYGVNSVLKPSFGKQHFINSMLYVKIPFKK